MSESKIITMKQPADFEKMAIAGRAVAAMHQAVRDAIAPGVSMKELDAIAAQVLRELYPKSKNLEIARQLNRSVKSMVSKAHNLGLKKDRERLREMGRENVRLRYSKDLE